MAEREGFEPPGPCGPAVFKTAAIDHSATSPTTGGPRFGEIDRCRGFSSYRTRSAHARSRSAYYVRVVAHMAPSEKAPTPMFGAVRRLTAGINAATSAHGTHRAHGKIEL